jgi:sugar lactone lactonase YvrE
VRNRSAVYLIACVVISFCAAGCNAGATRSATVPAVAPQAASAQAPASGPFLYVGGSRISKYALGSTTPLRTVEVKGPVEVIALATDSFGHLFAEYGNPTSGGVIAVYDARTLAIDYIIPNTAGWGNIALDSKGNLYYCFGDPIFVYPPGKTRAHYKIEHNARQTETLAFDSSGDLYADDRDRISVFAPNGPDGRMEWVRSFSNGVHNADALAFGPNDDLYVANCPRCPYSHPGKRINYVTVFAPNGSRILRKIFNGVSTPVALAVDSTGRLYVADAAPYHHPERPGRVVVYAPGGSEPIATIKDGISGPHALAIDSSDNVYVENADSVTVYNPGGTMLLRTITKGIRFVAASMTIGSP